MSEKTLILYSSVDGQTLKICNRIKDVFLQSKKEVEIYSIENFNREVTNYDKLILGASIRYGVHNKKVINFINSNKTNLDQIKTAFFSVNLVARKEDKNTPTTNPYVIKFFKTIDWTPSLVEVFAGKLNYKKYPIWDKLVIQFIMWMTKGPVNSDANIEYTDWEKVKRFSLKVKDL